MVITSREDVEKALKSVGFYRLRGYSFHLYDNATKKYVPGTKFEDILRLYQFDQELSSLIFLMISKIEVALRVRLVEAPYFPFTTSPPQFGHLPSTFCSCANIFSARH